MLVKLSDSIMVHVSLIRKVSVDPVEDENLKSLKVTFTDDTTYSQVMWKGIAYTKAVELTNVIKQYLAAYYILVNPPHITPMQIPVVPSPTPTQAPAIPKPPLT